MAWIERRGVRAPDDRSASAWDEALREMEQWCAGASSCYAPGPPPLLPREVVPTRLLESAKHLQHSLEALESLLIARREETRSRLASLSSVSRQKGTLA